MFEDIPDYLGIRWTIPGIYWLDLPGFSVLYNPSMMEIIKLKPGINYKTKYLLYLRNLCKIKVHCCIV